MDLYIVEKPSVGRELASFLAKKRGVKESKGDGCIMVGGDFVTWCRGHLKELAEFDHYMRPLAPAGAVFPDGRVSWSKTIGMLPFFPQRYEYIPSVKDSDKRAQLKVVEDLIRKADVVYHAGDRDREGQAIVDNILEGMPLAGKKIQRLAFSATDDKSFESALHSCESNEQPKFKNVGLAARARAIADMSIGLNLTRILSVMYSTDGVMTAGRVQTPLLGIVVERQWLIDNFKPRDFYVPIVVLPDGTELEWSSRAGERGDGFDEDGRIIDQEVAKRIVDQINAGLQGRINDASSKEVRKAPPLPYALPDIQSEMSARHGISVKDTTAACQSLYEKKMQTYIGTDCRYLPESMHAAAGEILSKMHGRFKSAVEGAKLDIKYKCWDDSKVAAHHAIIPTGEAGTFANEVEEKVYRAVSSRYLAQFHPESVTLKTRLSASFGQDVFTATRSDVISPGWMAVDSDAASDEDGDRAQKNEDKHVADAR